MSEARSRVSTRVATPVRAALIALAAVQAVNGLYALLAPRSFYEDFPFGRGWVAALPEYSEHLVRDVGGLFLATAILLGVAGVVLERRLVTVAAAAFLAFSVPHTVFHAFNLEPYAAGDVIANLVALAATVLVPIWILVAVRSAAPAAGPGSSAPVGDEGGRIGGVPDSTRNPLVRYAYRQSRKRGAGEVMAPLRVFAHNPTLMMGYGMLELAHERSQLLPPRLAHLATMRAAMLCGCEWCLDFGSAISTEHGVDEDDLRALPDYGASERFDSRERLVLDYADAMSRTPAAVSEQLFASLRGHFDEPQLVELTSLIALENYRARFNWAFGLGSQGYSEGGHCVRAQAIGASAGT